jgi:hypothetical protein
MVVSISLPKVFLFPPLQVGDMGLQLPQGGGSGSRVGCGKFFI